MEQHHIAIVIYPGMTALDFVAPQHVFSTLLNTTVHLVVSVLGGFRLLPRDSPANY
jgi:hypothetical protein